MGFLKLNWLKDAVVVLNGGLDRGIVGLYTGGQTYNENRENGFRYRCIYKGNLESTEKSRRRLPCTVILDMIPVFRNMIQNYLL